MKNSSRTFNPAKLEAGYGDALETHPVGVDGAGDLVRQHHVAGHIVVAWEPIGEGANGPAI
jgi:hypothetical protein